MEKKEKQPTQVKLLHDLDMRIAAEAIDLNDELEILIEFLREDGASETIEIYAQKLLLLIREIRGSLEVLEVQVKTLTSQQQ